ncbi:hypothetical protein HY486_03475 [Candidatus Woesearchaeota archaeon]|nr:hypothetical protein [Candidatus Woesearchaeota archaeon]
MRDITEGELAKEIAKLEDMLQKEEEQDSGLQTRAGIKIPRWFLRKFLGKVRLYETEDVQDILDNYSTLSKAERVPISCVAWVALKTITNKKFYSFAKEASDVLDCRLKDLTFPNTNTLKQVVNFAAVDNVRLCSPKIVKSEKWEVCEFEIVDRYDWSIRGVFKYRDTLENDSTNEEKAKQIAQVLNAPDSQTFDIQFIAMAENYLIHTYKSAFKQPRGKKLLVHNIHRTKGDKEKIDTPDGGTRIKPILQYT